MCNPVLETSGNKIDELSNQLFSIMLLQPLTGSCRLSAKEPVPPRMHSSPHGTYPMPRLESCGNARYSQGTTSGGGTTQSMVSPAPGGMSNRAAGFTQTA
ncbi:hypothetical protein DPEC_G00202800 [Dallia pectoralis]|uniref:Uncharacterized protein n=1 Tax=Dallia pectoralis TaxID=75939 RepID=A0ACC2G9C5_DALPE|nr:hypothetical protein DPEC_G00202800 [Dallia pectoralis]